jgi:hypothetical protein
MLLFFIANLIFFRLQAGLEQGFNSGALLLSQGLFGDGEGLIGRNKKLYQQKARLKRRSADRQS